MTARAAGTRGRRSDGPTEPGTPVHSVGRPRDAEVSKSILAAARRQLERIGYAKMTMEGVAAEAGVARTTVYRRFRDKGDLVTAAIADGLTLADGSLSDDPKRDLTAFIKEFDRRSGQCLVEVLGSLLGSREETATLELHRRRVITPRSAYAHSLLLRACELGELRADTDVELAKQMLVGAVFARQVAGASPRPGWVAHAVDVIWRAWGVETG